MVQFTEHIAADKLDISTEAPGDDCTRNSEEMNRTAALAREQWNRCKVAILNGGENIIVLNGSPILCTTDGSLSAM